MCMFKKDFFYRNYLTATLYLVIHILILTEIKQNRQGL